MLNQYASKDWVLDPSLWDNIAINFTMENTMSVDSWQPVQVAKQLDPTLLRKLTQLALQYSSADDLTADFTWIQPLVLIDNKIWAQSALTLENNELIGLIQILTIIEQAKDLDLSDKSPVIPLFKALRKKIGIDKELVQWVKEHSDNKYLPFGPLL